MHLLDFILFFPIMGIIWFLLDKFSNGELTNELGGCVGTLVMLLCAAIYIVLFTWIPDLNWVDIFKETPTIIW
jgi:hypothetical protein